MLIRRYADIGLCRYFLVADTDTADTEKSADMPIFPIPIHGIGTSLMVVLLLVGSPPKNELTYNISKMNSRM